MKGITFLLASILGVRFVVLTESRQRVRGILTVNVVANAHELTAFSLVELDLDSV